LATLDAAVRDLAKGLESLRVSSVWKSKARYLLDQPPFLNLVVEGRTEITPLEFLDFTSSIEAAHGRDRSKEAPKGPRNLDIDLLLFGDRIVRSERLMLPHPCMEERRFVLLPLLELDAALYHPVSGLPFLTSLAALPAQGIYLLRSRSYDRIYI
jgi:2-amino-4-hydroxy-6-hydroxymethyldihydropteridine diphosphokinase